MRFELSLPSWTSSDRAQSLDVTWGGDEQLFATEPLGVRLEADDGFETTTIHLTPAEAIAIGQALVDLGAEHP